MTSPKNKSTENFEIKKSRLTVKLKNLQNN